uniref:Uncharacterized protein n=1 Tax=Cucumis sativus TaxID=3659 RepID=A0A0A0L2P9_CUCSA
MREAADAPSNVPTTGKVAEAALDGPGAGDAASSEAKTMLREAATVMKAAQAKFFISMMKV